MEPRIKYTATTDGVSIAWREQGEGPALLLCGPMPFTHVQEQVPAMASWYAGAARSFRLITFDARGTGMSERDVAGVSAETLMLDTEAVIDAAKLDRFIVLTDPGSILPISTCLRLAIAYPDRVTHLVLECPFPSLQEIADTSMARAGLALAELDWAAFLQTVYRVLLGLDAPSAPIVEALAAGAARWVDQPIGIQYIRECEKIDVSDLLPQVRQPTLVLRNDPYFVPARCCQRVAAKIPGAQFLQYSDPTFVQQIGLITAFVAQSSPLPTQGALAPSAFRTVLFTDLVGHTEMMSRLGDGRGRDVLREHERITREVLKANGGTEVKTMGDGFMASFGSVTKAVECAIALQKAFADWTDAQSSTPDPRPLTLAVRCGLNAGEPIEEDGDLFGATVILASRIAAKANGGEILVADTVRGLCSGKGFLFADRGEFVAKGFEEPVRISEVSWRS